MELRRELAAWIEQVAGGPIVSVEHQGRWRPHFFVDVERGGEKLPLLVRLERDPDLVAGSRFQSHFDLAHEAAILSALQGRGIAVPRLYGLHTAPPAILMSCVRGSPVLDDLSDQTRNRVLREYIEQLAKLHSLPIDAETAPNLVIPETSEDLALANCFAYMERDYQEVRLGLEPEPLLDFALWWVHANIPRHRSACSLLQGDTGPGQFLVHDGHVTALIDWELSHVGDPLWDLGVMRTRNMMYPIGNLNECIHYYAEVTGQSIDREALCFYTVLAMLMSPLGMVESIQRPSASIPTMLPRFGWDATMRRGLCDALCEAYGVEFEAPSLSVSSGPANDLHRYLVDHLQTHCVPTAKSEYDRYLLTGAAGIARTLEQGHRFGQRLDQDDLDDMEKILGWRPRSRSEGLSSVGERVEVDPAGNAISLLWLFSRIQRRREILLAPLMTMQDSQAFERMFPAEKTMSQL